MVYVKVRETYDLHTTKNKMTVIAIHTPKPDILKRNYPGLLMQCRAYRPVSADVRLACASVLPLDPKGIGLAEGDVSPEDVFNPILYKAMSNKGMSQLEGRINQFVYNPVGVDVSGSSSDVEVDGTTTQSNEFDLYYGLLSQTKVWKHANPQNGLSMTKLKPYVYELVYNIGDVDGPHSPGGFVDADNRDYESVGFPLPSGTKARLTLQSVVGNAKPFPFLNCTSYTYSSSKSSGWNYAGFPEACNCEQDVPYLPVVCGCIIVPPSRLHEMFYRMVVEWTIEFSKIRPVSELGNWSDLAGVGNNTHYQNYSYEATKEAITGSSETILEKDSCMVSSNVDVDKVM